MKKAMTLGYLIFIMPVLAMENYNVGPLDYSIVPVFHANVRGASIRFELRQDDQHRITILGNDLERRVSFYHSPNTDLQMTTRIGAPPGRPEYLVRYPRHVKLELYLDDTTATISSISHLEATLKNSARLTVEELGNANIQTEGDATLEGRRGSGESLKITISGGNVLLEQANYTRVELARNHLQCDEKHKAIGSRIIVRNARIDTLKATVRTAFLDNFGSPEPSIGVWGTVRVADLKIFPNFATETIFIEEVTEQVSDKVIQTGGQGINSSIIVSKRPNQ